MRKFMFQRGHLQHFVRSGLMNLTKKDRCPLWNKNFLIFYPFSWWDSWISWSCHISLESPWAAESFFIQKWSSKYWVFSAKSLNSWLHHFLPSYFWKFIIMNFVCQICAIHQKKAHMLVNILRCKNQHSVTYFMEKF